MVVYLGWLIPYRKRKLQVVWVLVPATTVVGHFRNVLQVLVHYDINVHFSCLFITISRIRSFIIVHLTFVSVFYHKKWFGITSLRYHFHNIDICRSDW